MTTDRKLLELAAKAAGIEGEALINTHGDAFFRKKVRDVDTGEHGWNPLTDDGDALRLAVRLNMGISIPIHRTIRADVVCFQHSSIYAREEGNDPYAATRRAIVRAAAGIGRGMK